jgi:hypothetical protein
MELTIEQIEIANRIKVLNKQIDEIYYELDDMQEIYYIVDKNEQARILGVCDYLDSKAFSYRMELDALTSQLNDQGITDQSHPSIFPTPKAKLDINDTSKDLIDDLPF